jgi:NAD(P)-dependent dehydrogenase (short-subunit alcohol dehydrogenase family)
MEAVPFNLENKVAFITGAGQGIGRGIALMLARHGADIAVNDLISERAEITVEEVKKLKRRSIAVPGDVGVSREVKKMVSDAKDYFEHIDILVNNAGWTLYKPILECSEDVWDKHVNTIAKGTFLCMQQIAPLMIERKWGRIINIGSYVAQLNCTTKFFGPYCTAKFGVIGLTQVAAQEFAPYVLVNAVGPGDVETELMELEWEAEGKLRNIPASKVKKEYEDRILLRRLEQPEDIARVVAFLCSPYADMITGAHIIASGGLPYTHKPW